MLQEVASDYANYLKLDLPSGFQSVQDAIDNMITRLEELTSVLQMIKLKNRDCTNIVTEDISHYRNEVTKLSKKIVTITDVVFKLQSNTDILEKRVEKAEMDFGVQVDNKFKSLLKPFLKKKDINPGTTSLNMIPPDKTKLTSVLDSFEGSDKNL